MSAPVGDSWETCPVCQGSGVEAGDAEGDLSCFRCEGHGELWVRDPEDHAEDHAEDDGCPDCGTSPSASGACSLVWWPMSLPDSCAWCGESHPIEEARLKCGFCGAAVTCADADNRNSSDCERCWNEEKAERRAEMEADEREEHAKLMADAWEAERRAEMEADEREEHAKLMADAWEHDAYDRKGDR